jgi:hypothetical protein
MILILGADPGFQVRGGANIFGVFRVKNHDFTPKNHIFSNFRGGARAGCSPLNSMYESSVSVTVLNSREKIPYEVLLACNASRVCVWCGKRGEG